jgi:hypothetical protein
VTLPVLVGETSVIHSCGVLIMKLQEVGRNECLPVFLFHI